MKNLPLDYTLCEGKHCGIKDSCMRHLTLINRTESGSTDRISVAEFYPYNCGYFLSYALYQDGLPERVEKI